MKHFTLFSILLSLFISKYSFNQIFSEDFTVPQSWTFIDGNNDNSTWSIGVPFITTAAWPAGNKVAISYSFDLNIGGVTPDNILVSPTINMSTASSPITFSWDSGTTESTGADSYQEYYSVYVLSSTAIATINPAFLDGQTPIFSGLLTAGNSVIPQSFDISGFAGQSDVKLVFRHHNCTEEWNLLIDNVLVSGTVSLSDNDGDTYLSDVDCDDNDPTVYPGAPEICDGKDNDCNNMIDDGLTMTTYYTDADMDNFGTGTGVAMCSNPGAGFSTVDGDCDDANASINPGATDIPDNGIDEDCNGSDATSVVDNDGDGSPAGTDCDDNDNTVYPGAPELCDGKDNDCNNAIDDGLVMTTYYTDTDMDNFGTGTGTDYCSNPGAGFATVDGDCNDADAAINPAATDIPNNGIDEDCSGADTTTAVDNDGDGADSSVDCDDNDNTVYPGAPELCDGKDNDCNNAIDDGLTMTTYYTDTDMDNFGTGAGTDYCSNPGAGFATVDGDCNDADAAINPAATDIPNNGIDEDCSGADATTTVDNDGDGADNSVDCDDNDNTVYPGAPELCDGKDNDCNNAIDDGLTMTTYYTDADIDNFGTGTGVALCSNPGAGFATVDGDCNDANNAINPGATDIPGNGIDEDCSGADASNADPVANDDSGTCIENGLNASISILANDTDPSGTITNLTHTVDLDIATAGVQGSFTSASPAVSWVYNSTFQTLSCDPGQDVEGIVTLTYKLCNISNGLCDQAVVTVTVTPSTASISENSIVYSLFPNPTTGKLNILSSTTVQTVKVFSYDGKMILHSELNGGSAINVDGLTNGLYYLELNFENGTSSRTTFVKQ